MSEWWQVTLRHVRMAGNNTGTEAAVAAYEISSKAGRNQFL
jgi:hypothetical protein